MLFHRLHLQLTALCALITITILSVFTILYLCVAEHTMKENLLLSFQNNFDTLCESLERQPVLTYQYLLRMEQNNDYMIFLWDNGTPLTFNDLESHSAYLALADSVYEDFRASKSSSSLSFSENRFQKEANVFLGIRHLFPVKTDAFPYATALRSDQGLVLMVISTNPSLHARLVKQRLIFALLSLFGCVLLTAFSYFFTGKMLIPIRENHQKQLSFLAGASHELRTPLAVILSAIQARPPHFEDTVKTETMRMGKLVDEMLLLSRLDRQNTSLSLHNANPLENPALFQPVPLEPDTFLLDFYEQMESYVRSTGRSLSLFLPDEPFPKLCADQDKLRQLLEILIQNAVSYTRDGGHICLSLSYEKKAQKICFQVSDDGIGIPDAEKDKIFERFYRSEDARSSKEHFGLGLCIAQEIVQTHKGRILVTDTPGGGCTFRCLFPCAKTPS